MQKQGEKTTDQFYSIRLKELNSLLNKSQSKTSGALIEEAIMLTNTTFNEMKKVSKIAKDKIEFYNSKQAYFDKSLATMDIEMSKIKIAASNEMFSVITRRKVLEAYEAMMGDIKVQYEKRTNANRLIREVIVECNAKLNDTLLEKIYKPDSSRFIFDSIVEIFSSIVQSMIPFSDKAEWILEMSISKRKKEYLSNGDKLLSYLEDYNSILNSWLMLNNQFEKEVLN